MTTLIISTSLSESSRSRMLANHVNSRLEDSEIISLKDYDLPLCDGGEAYSHPNVIKLK